MSDLSSSSRLRDPAAANMATFPLLIAFLFFQKQLVEGVALSGLK